MVTKLIKFQCNGQNLHTLFLTHIKLGKDLYDAHTLMNESLETFKSDKTSSESSQNKKNLHDSTIKVLELVAYTHIFCETLAGQTQAAERMT